MRHWGPLEEVGRHVLSGCNGQAAVLLAPLPRGRPAVWGWSSFPGRLGLEGQDVVRKGARRSGACGGRPLLAEVGSTMAGVLVSGRLGLSDC